MKRLSYPKDSDEFLNIISSTSSKEYTKEEMKEFIDKGFWRTRKSGLELNFGHDPFETGRLKETPYIDIFRKDIDWQEWAKTIGVWNRPSEKTCSVIFQDKEYFIQIEDLPDRIRLLLINTYSTKQDLKFSSLMKSTIIKSLFCVGCQACEVECKFGGLDMSNGVKITEQCIHCFKCHDVHSHCLRYNSIRNRNTEVKSMASLDRYATFGTQGSWVNAYCKYKGGKEFWETGGDGNVVNKKMDSFVTFLKDAGMARYDKNAGHDKYSRYVPTDFAQTIFKLGGDSPVAWALILCNMVYTNAIQLEDFLPLFTSCR